MNYRKTFLPSSQQETQIALYQFIPSVPPRAIFQICHTTDGDMADYTGLAEMLTENGILVCGIDQIGHGDSVSEKHSKGALSSGSAFSSLVSDQKLVYDTLRKTYRHLPYLLFGREIGAIVSRKLIVAYRDLFDGVILVDDSVCQKNFSLEIFLSSVVASLRGKEKTAHYLQRRFFKGEELYAPKTPYTNEFYRQWLCALRDVNGESWYGEVPLSLPTLLLGREENAGLETLYENLANAELCLLQKKLYPGSFDTWDKENRDVMQNDILAFSNQVIEGVCDARTEHFSFGFSR